ncbi:MAG: endonuclease domain-containing protein [Myxococcales bacterium]
MVGRRPGLKQHTWEQYRTAVSRAREMRKLPTRVEALLWNELRRRGVLGEKFRRQHPLGKFIVDFYVPALRIAIEVDGPHHAEQREYDMMRQRFLESQKVRFLRFTTEEVEGSLEACLERIRSAIREQRPHK